MQRDLLWIPGSTAAKRRTHLAVGSSHQPPAQKGQTRLRWGAARSWPCTKIQGNDDKCKSVGNGRVEAHSWVVPHFNTTICLVSYPASFELPVGLLSPFHSLKMDQLKWTIELSASASIQELLKPRSGLGLHIFSTHKHCGLFYPTVAGLKCL